MQMPTRLVCLSNSNKLGGRCLAGIELDNQNNPVIIYGRPKWIRPICNTGLHPRSWTKYVRVVGSNQSPVKREKGTCHEAPKEFCC